MTNEELLNDLIKKADYGASFQSYSEAYDNVLSRMQTPEQLTAKENEISALKQMIYRIEEEREKAHQGLINSSAMAAALQKQLHAYLGLVEVSKNLVNHTRHLPPGGNGAASWEAWTLFISQLAKVEEENK